MNIKELKHIERMYELIDRGDVKDLQQLEKIEKEYFLTESRLFDHGIPESMDDIITDIIKYIPWYFWRLRGCLFAINKLQKKMFRCHSENWDLKSEVERLKAEINN